MRKLKLVVEYLGSGFSGYQMQNERPTIQKSLVDALYHLTGERLNLSAAGRTDAGVHAEGQVVSFYTQSSLPIRAIVHGTNAYLPKNISVLHAEEVPASFDARHSASGKKYRYQIWNSPFRSPLREKTYYQVRTPLHTELMQQAASLLEGTHDFRAFRASDCERKTTIRHIHRICIFEKISPFGKEIFIEVDGTAFLKNMVRIISGTLIQVGMESTPPSHISTLLSSLDRRQAGPTAPGHGLFLCHVAYGERKQIHTTPKYDPDPSLWPQKDGLQEPEADDGNSSPLLQ